VLKLLKGGRFVTNHTLTPDQQFIIYHDKLRNELNKINVHFIIREQLGAVWQDYINELNAAPTFFAFTMDAHTFATLMGLNRLIDTKQGHLSIYKFLNFVKENTSIFSKRAVIKRLRRDKRYDERALRNKSKITGKVVDSHIQKIRDLPTSSIRRWRIEILAHIQANSALQNMKISNVYPIKTEQIKQVLNTIDGILNFYLLNYDARTWAIAEFGASQVNYILESIRFFVQHQANKYKEMTTDN
jgi:hypothetical protein